MEINKKEHSKTPPAVFFILTFIVAVLFELYWINNFPYDYFMLIGVGLIIIITGFLSFDSIFRSIKEAEEIKREQNELMIKAQKAIYLATKKNAADIESKQIKNIENMELMFNRIFDTIESRNLLSTKEEAKDITDLITQLTSSNDKLAKEVQNAITVNELVKANADLLENVKQVLNGSSAATRIEDAPVKAPTPMVSIAEPVITPIVSIVEPVISEEPVFSEVLEDLKSEDISPMENTASLISDEELENVLDDEVIIETDSSIDKDVNEAYEYVETINEEIIANEAVLELENDIESVIEAYDEIEEETTKNSDEKPVFKEPTDPNATMSPEEIAALFASL